MTDPAHPTHTQPFTRQELRVILREHLNALQRSNAVAAFPPSPHRQRTVQALRQVIEGLALTPMSREAIPMKIKRWTPRND